MAYNHIKSCSDSLVIVTVKSETSRCLSAPIRLAKTTKSGNLKGRWEPVRAATEASDPASDSTCGHDDLLWSVALSSKSADILQPGLCFPT